MTSKHVKEAIDEWRDRHNATQINNKDMLMYVVAKVDKIDEKLGKHIERAAAEDGQLRGKVNLHDKFIFAIITALLLLGVAVAASRL